MTNNGQDIVTRLIIKAGVMEMGERIAWGSDTALMREAAEEIKRLRLAKKEAKEALDVVVQQKQDALLTVKRLNELLSSAHDQIRKMAGLNK